MTETRNFGLALSLVVSLSILPGTVWAGPDRRATGVKEEKLILFPAHPVCRRPYLCSGFARPFPSAIVSEPAVVQPTPVWVPGFWAWNGVDWVWVPDHWAW
jgi:hypothetical protein